MVWSFFVEVWSYVLEDELKVWEVWASVLDNKPYKIVQFLSVSAVKFEFGSSVFWEVSEIWTDETIKQMIRAFGTKNTTFQGLSMTHR